MPAMIDVVAVLNFPAAFNALTVIRYDLPLTRVGMVQVRAAEPTTGQERIGTPGEDALTTYPEIAAPPVKEGATHDTTTALLRGEPATDRDGDGFTAVTVSDCGTPLACCQFAVALA